MTGQRFEEEEIDRLVETGAADGIIQKAILAGHGNVAVRGNCG